MDYDFPLFITGLDFQYHYGECQRYFRQNGVPEDLIMSFDDMRTRCLAYIDDSNNSND